MKPEDIKNFLEKRLSNEEKRKNMEEAMKDGSLGLLIKEALDFDQFNAKYDKWAKTQASLPSNGQRILAPAAPWSAPGPASAAPWSVPGPAPAAPGPALSAPWSMPAAPWAGPQGAWSWGVQKKTQKPRQQACQICRGYNHLAPNCPFK